MTDLYKDTDIEASLVAMATLPEERYNNFLSADPAKQDRIIKVAMELFAAQGYAHVSTNELVKKAEISKGLLFHYFNSKAGLYQYLQRHVIALMAEAILSNMDVSGGDVFDVLWQSVEIKLKVTAQYPLAVQFYTNSLIDKSVPEEIRSATQAGLDASYDAMDLVTSNLDEELLKEGLDRDMVAKTIYRVCNSMAHEILDDLDPNPTEEYWQKTATELKSYFDFLREIFYKDSKGGN